MITDLVYKSYDNQNKYDFCLMKFTIDKIIQAIGANKSIAFDCVADNITPTPLRSQNRSPAQAPLDIMGLIEWPDNKNPYQKLQELGDKILKMETKILVDTQDINAAVARLHAAIDVESKEDAIQATLDVMIDAITAVQVKLDMEPTIDPKVNNDKSKKPKARKPKAVKDDGGEEIPDEKSLFNRNLLETGNDGMKRTIEAMEGKLDSVEEEIKTTSIAVQDEVELIKGEVKGMKVKVESMESKVDKIEQSMKNIEDMLSKLLTTGGVAAG